MYVLVLNCGSSSLKFQLVDTSLERIATNSDRRLARGVIERIGGQALLTFSSPTATETYKETAPIRDHRQAVDRAVQWLTSEANLPLKSVSEISAVGHRVVHGGEHFKDSILITPEVIKEIEDCIDLAPLHNPANLKGIRATQSLLGTGLPQVAVFDTAFHQSIAEPQYLYPIPYSLYRRHRIRRYGFHGTSHRFVAYRYRTLLGIPKDKVNVISLHLGNGCSACAIRNGKSFDTSMGVTPLEGLMMGTRSGDIDPSVVEILMQGEGFSISEVDSLLNKQSGLLGISGLTSDMRDLLFERSANKDRRATLAIDMFCNRITKYIGAYLAEMGGADALIFTGGIGQNAPELRSQICKSLGFMNLTIDEQRNKKIVGESEGEISSSSSKLKAYMIPTDEELLIARDTVRCLNPVT